MIFEYCGGQEIGEHGERRLNSNELTHSAMNGSIFSNPLPTRGKRERTRGDKQYYGR